MQQIAITIPTEVLVSPASKFGFLTDRRTLSLAGGGLRSRARGRRPVKTISISPGLMSSGDLDKLNLALLQIRRTGGCFWAINPEERVHVDRLATPLTDGTRTTFQIGVVSASDVTVFADGVPVEASEYTLHAAANLFDESTSLANMNVVSGHCSDELVDGVSLFGGQCLKIVPFGNGSNPYMRTVASGYGDTTVGEAYTILFIVLPGEAETWRPDSLWYSVSPSTYVGAVAGDQTGLSSGSWQTIGITSNSLAVEAEARLYLMDSTTTVPFYVGGLALIPGDYETWHLPSESPSLVEFNTAPAAGTVITVTGYGKAITRYALQREVGWAEEAGGYKIPDVIQGIESPEVR